MNNVFFQSLVHGIATAKGDLILYVSEGAWQADVSGSAFTLHVPADCTLEVTFDYSYGVLNSAALNIDTGIKVAMPDGTTVTVRSATYNRLGDCTGVISDAAALPDASLSQLKRLLTIRREPSHLLLGTLFEYLGSATPTPSAGNPAIGSNGFVTRIRFERNEALPGLSLSLKDRSTLRFADTLPGAAMSNELLVLDPTGASLDSLDYDIAHDTLDGSLSTFVANVDSGTIFAGTLLLNLSGGSSIRFDNVTFGWNSRTGAVVDASFGDVSATIASGNISFDDDARPSEVTIEAATKIQLLGFRLTTTGHNASVIVDPGSTIAGSFTSGTLRFGTSVVSFGETGVACDFGGKWGDGSGASDVGVRFTNLSASKCSGELALGTGSLLSFVDGAFSTTDLAYTTGVGISGTFQQFDFAMSPGAACTFAEGVELIAAAGGHIDATHGGTPLRIAAGVSPEGSISIDQPFQLLQLAQPAALSITNGSALFVLNTLRDGSATSMNGALSGTLPVKAPGISATSSISITGMALSRTSSGSVTLSGVASGSIQPGVSYTFTTPFVRGTPGHDNMRLFPCTMTASLSAALPFGPSALDMRAGAISLSSLALTVPIGVSIPAGLGEHEDSDDPNSADGTHGPGEDQGRQEAYTDTFSALRVHIYPYVANYGLTASVNVSFAASQLSVDVTSVTLDAGQQVQFHRDGGDLGVIGAIIGGIAGGLLFGWAGPPVGAVIGGVAGADLNGIVNKLIQAGLATQILQLHASWQVHV